jgi:PHD/YefM family antitoxin component YafN of YafNO toxin-antitoxin module
VIVVNFYSVTDLRNTSNTIWDDLSSDGQVVITNNGKPSAIMLKVADGSLEETIMAIKQAKAMLAFNSMRQTAAEHGYMTDEEIEAEISAARQGIS